LLNDATGFLLMVHASEGYMAEINTMLPVVESFMATHQLPDVTVVADAGVISEASQKGDRGRRAVVHPRHEDPACPLPGRAWRHEHPGQQIPGGHVFTQPWPAGC
jgi:hypothetical protein